MRPQVSEQEAKDLAQCKWGCAASLAAPLDGYDDRNLKIEGPDGAAWVLKVHNSADSCPQSQYAEAQNALLDFLKRAGLPVPAPLPLLPHPLPSTGNSSSSSNEEADACTLRLLADDGKRHAVRMLSWLPGSLLVDVAQSAELYCQLGDLLARVNLALQGWDWTATGALRRPDFEWNLQHLVRTYARIRPDLLALPQLDVPLLDAVVQHFEAATAAAGQELRQSIIHSDANERNVLVDAAEAAAAAAAEQAALGGGGAGPARPGASGGCPGPVGQTPAPPPRLITGLIDWGDACWQWLAAEPAIAAVYMMLLDANCRDPLPAAAALLCGYQRRLPLLRGELRALRALCMGRLAQSLSLGARAAARQPDNTAYLLGTQRNGWRLLRTLWSLSDEQFLAALDCAEPV